jgi:hypothetical protein
MSTRGAPSQNTRPSSICGPFHWTSIPFEKQSEGRSIITVCDDNGRTCSNGPLDLPDVEAGLLVAPANKTKITTKPEKVQ